MNNKHMTKRQILLLFACVLFGVVTLTSLVVFSPIAAPIARQPFVRNFESRIRLEKRGEVDLNVNSFYCAGSTEQSIFLGNVTAPLHMVVVDLPNLDTQHIILNIKNIKTPDNYRAFRLKVDPPYFYLMHGTMPGIFGGLISSRQASSVLPVNFPYFVEAVPVSPTLFALKSLSLEDSANELATLNRIPPYFQFKPEILQKQIDGIFCEEGKLHYEKSKNRLVYVYSYRNEFIVMDTTLDKINRHHTIDTFSRAKLNVAKVASKNYTTLASPQAFVNLLTAVSGDFLFVLSPLLSQNEDKIRFQQASVLDIYDITSGRYLYSFYLDHVDNHIPTSLLYNGTTLAAVFGHRLILYNLDLPRPRDTENLLN
jgi:hypothetical protein